MLESDEILFVDNLCRTCLEPANDLRSLFKVGRICGQKTKLSLMLIESFAIEVSENDGLPEKICSKCMIQISKSYNFKLQCIKSENVLRTKLVNTQPVFKTTEELENELSDEPIAVPMPLKMEFYDNAANMEEEEEVEEANYPTERLQSINEHDEMELELEEVVDENEEIIIEHSEVTDEYTIKVCEDNDNSVSIEYASCYDDKYETETATEDQHLDMENDGLSGAPSVLKPEAKKKFPCTICLKVLSNANSFKYHMQLHSDEKPFLCNECGERFKTPNAYAGHMSTHKTEYQHKCDKCDKVYRQAASLRSHQLTHTGEKPFVCNICGKGVTQKSGFKECTSSTVRLSQLEQDDLGRISKDSDGDSVFINKMLISVFGVEILKKSSLSGRSGPKLNNETLLWIKGKYYERFRGAKDEQARLNKFNSLIKVKINNMKSYKRKDPSPQPCSFIEPNMAHPGLHPPPPPIVPNFMAPNMHLMIPKQEPQDMCRDNHMTGAHPETAQLFQQSLYHANMYPAVSTVCHSYLDHFNRSDQ